MIFKYTWFMFFNIQNFVSSSRVPNFVSSLILLWISKLRWFQALKDIIVGTNKVTITSTSTTWSWQGGGPKSSMTTLVGL